MHLQFHRAMLAWFFMLSMGVANASKLPRSLVQLSPAEVSLFNDLSDGTLNQFNLIETSLAASGATDPATIARYHAKYKALSKSIRRDVASLPTKHQKAQGVHKLLHRNLFKKYHVYANSLTDVFDKGRYNCVSAAIIENAILEDMGIKTKAVRTPTHVYSLVYTEKGAIEIENTAAEGFNPIRSKSRWRNMLKRQRRQMNKEDRESIAAYIQAIDANKREIIDNQTLAAALYSNTGVLRSRAGSKRSQLSNFIKAALLSKGDPLYVETMEALLHNQIVYFLNLNQNNKALAAMNDTAILVGNQREWQRKFKDWKISIVDNKARIHAQGSRYSQAVETYEQGLKVWPNDALLTQNRRVALLEWAEDLIGKNKCALGFEIFQSLFSEKKDQALIQNRYIHSVKSCSDRLQQRRKGQQAINLVKAEQQRSKKQFVGRDRKKNLRVIENLLAEAYFNAGQYENAATWFGKGLPKTRQNYVAAINNQVAELINANQNQEAISIASSGLRKLADYGKSDPTLQELVWKVIIHECHRLYKMKQYQAALMLIHRMPSHQRPKGKMLQELIEVESALYVKQGRYKECIRSLNRLPRRMRARWVDVRTQVCKNKLK